MNEAILIKYLRQNPGARIRYMVSDLNITRDKLIPTLHHLEQVGIIEAKLYRDMANIEYYDKWYIKEN